MLARHAESLFWTGRYLERAEDTARMLDVTYHGLLGSATTADEEARAWLDLLSTLALEPDFIASGRQPTAEDACDFLVLDAANAGAIVSVVRSARENARSVRELIPTELWEAVNTFYLELAERDLRRDIAEQPYQLYGLVERRCQTVAGVAAETMPRDDGWRFLALGRMLERAEMTCRLLNVRLRELNDADELDRFQLLVGVLRSASAIEAFRKEHGADLDIAGVVEFLLLSRTFPRSVLHGLSTAEHDLAFLGEPDQLDRAQRIVGRMRAELEFAEIAELSNDQLATMLEAIQSGVRNACDAVATRYFRNLIVEITAIDFRPVAWVS